jgi:hypothetical protein
VVSNTGLKEYLAMSKTTTVIHLPQSEDLRKSKLSEDKLAQMVTGILASGNSGDRRPIIKAGEAKAAVSHAAWIRASWAKVCCSWAANTPTLSPSKAAS